MKTLTLTLLTTLITTPTFAKRDDDHNRVPRIKLRAANHCSDLQVENVVDWFKGYEEVNYLDQRIGKVFNQGSVGWCFTYTVRDLVHFQTGISPEIGMLAKDYYTGFVGTITGLFSNNEGGYTYNNLKRTIRNGLCEKGSINMLATPKNVEKLSCNTPKINISSYGKPYKKTGTHKGRGHSLYPQLDQYLSNGQMVAIAYNANGLRKDKYRTDGFFSKYNANHASTIVGRYFDEDTQNCTYIIRNSWGTNYNYALKGKQKDGYHTITEKDLSQSLSELTVFE